MPTENFDTETHLLLRVSQGDPIAFRRLFDAFSNQVYTLCIKVTKEPEQAKDLTQEIFARLWTRRERLASVHNFRAFLHTVAMNLLRNHLQKKVLDPSNEEYLLQYFGDSDAGPDELMEIKELQQVLRDAVNRLPPQLNRSFLLSRMGGMSHAEIARQMELSPLTVKSHITRALHFIRSYLEQHHTMGLLLLYLGCAARFF